MRRWATDWILAAAFAVATQLEIWLQVLQVPYPLGVRIVATLLTLTAAGALGLRRSRPDLAFWVNSAAVIALIGLGYFSNVYQWTNLVALFSIAAHGPRKQAWLALPVGVGGVALFFTRFAYDSDQQLALFGFSVAVWTVGWLSGRVYRDSIESTRLAAERDVSQQLADARESQLSLEEERNRIARELHDIIGHTVNVMVVHAGAGRQAVTRAGPDAEGATDHLDTATQAFTTIEQTGRSALVELDRVLGILRRDEASEDLSPMPTLTDLDALVARFTDAGLPVAVTVAGTRTTADVPSGVSLAAYRIITEALTNTMKHAEATSATVTVQISHGHVRAEIADDGAGDPQALQPNRGITGMRERAGVYGGDVQLTRVSDRFIVVAELPWERSTP